MIEFAEKKKKLSQVQVLAKELAKRSLTGKQIENELGIMNYKGRIFDLRWIIPTSIQGCVKTKMITKGTRWGVSRIALYKIGKDYRHDYKKFLRDFLK